MMISPKTYREKQENKSYKDLLEEREKLLKKILEFENNFDENSDTVLDDMVIISPSPEVIYQCNLKYLAQLCDLIAEKYNHEFIGIL